MDAASPASAAGAAPAVPDGTASGEGAPPSPGDGAAALLERARRWAALGREDRAAEAWRQLLRSDPAQPDALFGLGVIAARAGRSDEARRLLARLLPDDPRARSLAKAIEVGTDRDRHLAKARAAARAGDAEVAVAAYRALFGDGPPPDALAVEFYETLAGTDAGWEEARDGLRRLAPDGLAYARVLTWREPTRREGLDRLAALARQPATAAAAKRDGLQALRWLDVQAGEAERFRAWLAVFGPDEALARRPRRTPPDLAPAWAALARGELDRADALFARHDGDAQALAGQAAVALRREDFERARTLLLRAKAKAPGRPELWARALRGAEFWLKMRAAALAAPALAPRLYEEAAALSPEDRHHADAALGRHALATGRPAEAEAPLRRAVDARPRDPDLLRDLIEVLLRTQREADAAAINARLRALDPKKALSDARLRAEVLRLRAAGAEDEAARALLLRAREADPTDPLVLLDLVYAHLRLGEVAEARALLDVLPTGSPARALVFEAEGRHRDALRALPKDAEPGLRRRLELRVALVGARGRVELLRLLRGVEDDPALMGLVASAWSERGDHRRALDTFEAALTRAPSPPTALRLQYAAALLRAGHDTELDATLDELAGDPATTARERRDLVRLRIGAAVRRADALRERGELEAAYAALAPALRDHPGDRTVLGALARLFHGAGAYEDAGAAWAKVLDAAPDDLAARQGAVLTALAAGEPEAAERLVDEGLKRRPDDAGMQLLAGRYFARMDEDERALDALRRARALARAPQPLVQAADDRFGGGSLPSEIQREIDVLRRRQHVQVGGATEIRRRDGEPGFGAVDGLRTPAHVRVPLGVATHATFTAEPVLLDAGTLALDDANVARRFGSVGARGLRGGAPRDQAAEGVAIGLAWRFRGLTLDVGSTPLGFPARAIVGGVRWDGRLGPVGLAVDVARRPVEDSLLSFAGARDPATGDVWGGVVRQGARLEARGTVRRLDWRASGGAHHVTGHDVAGNWRIEGGAGADWPLYDRDAARFTAGLAVSGMAHEHDLGHFTLGHGGYFSPQRFLRAGVPFSWTGVARRLRWEVRAAPGVNWFREADAPFYPDDATLQAAAGDVHRGQTRSGFAFDGLAVLGHTFGEGLDAGLRAGVHGARDYEEWTAGLYLRLDFQSRAP